MLTVNKLIARGRGLAAPLLERAPCVELDWDTRCKGRFDATDSSGRRLGVALASGQVVRGGDVLVAEDGSLVRVVAAPQPVLLVRPCAEHGTPVDLLRAAYRLGRRHVPLELQPDHLKLGPDPVLAGLLRRQHLIVSEERAAFEPEAGVDEAGGSDHAHAHTQATEPAHGHTHGHAHDHAQGHAHDHRHGHDSHGHGHDSHGHGHGGHGHGHGGHGHDHGGHGQDHGGHGHGHGRGQEPGHGPKAGRSQGSPH